MLSLFRLALDKIMLENPHTNLMKTGSKRHFGNKRNEEFTMTYNEILDELRGKLGDSREENENILRDEAERYAKEGNEDGIKAAGELLLENMSPEKKEEIERITHIDGVRLDEMYRQINQLISEHKIVEAKPLAERLYKKIIVEFKESEKAKFVSLRNPFEDNLCQFYYEYNKVLTRTPFDFASYITTYAYVLIETGSPLDAIPVLEAAMSFNPVDCGPKFELAEVYKLLGNRKKLFEITRETLRVASSPMAIARCYANVGYILVDAGEFEDAIIFYTASAMFYPNPAIPHEIRHASDLMGKPAVRPSHEKILETMKKYDIEYGPNQDVISVAAQLAADCLNREDIYNAVQAMKITYNLTLDEKVKELILKYDPQSARIVPQTNSEIDAVSGRNAKAPENNN